MTMRMNDFQLATTDSGEYQDPMVPIVSLLIDAAGMAKLYTDPWLKADYGDPDPNEVKRLAGELLSHLGQVLRDSDITMSEVAESHLKRGEREND